MAGNQKGFHQFKAQDTEVLKQMIVIKNAMHVCFPKIPEVVVALKAGKLRILQISVVDHVLAEALSKKVMHPEPMTRLLL